MAIPLRQDHIQIWIIDHARENVGLSMPDTSAVEAFYREYDNGTVEDRQRVDAEIVNIINTTDAKTDAMIIEFCIAHAVRIFPKEQTFLLMLKLWDTTASLDKEVAESIVKGFTIKAYIAGALSSTADEKDVEHITNLLLKAAPEIGIVPRNMVWMFTNTTRNFTALDTLVKTVKPAKNLKDAIWAAGYNMRRAAPGNWSATTKQLHSWPALLSKAYLAGGKAYEKILRENRKHIRGWTWPKPPQGVWTCQGNATMKLPGVWWYTEYRIPYGESNEDQQYQSLEDFFNNGPADNTIPADKLADMQLFGKNLRKKPK